METIPTKTKKPEKISELLNPSNFLERLLSLSDEALFGYFPELSELNFYLNRHGMETDHRFTVLDHSKRLLKNFALVWKYQKDQSTLEKDSTSWADYKKSFFQRILRLSKEIQIQENSEDLQVIVLALLLHDIGKGNADKTDLELREISRKSREKGRYLSFEYLQIWYRNKNHEERGAFLIYSLLEEIEGISQSFANRVKNLIAEHTNFSRLQTQKDFDFPAFLRRIMHSTTEYNYPLLLKKNPEERLIRELDIHYLVYLLDVYSVDDQGSIWYKIAQKKEMIYLKARWLLGKKLEDLFAILELTVPNEKESKKLQKEKIQKLFSILRKNFLKSLRTQTSILEDKEILTLYSSKESRVILSLISDYQSHTKQMYPLYLNHRSPKEKWKHIQLLNRSQGELVFDFENSENPTEIFLILTKPYAPEGTLLKVIQSLIYSSVELGRVLKIMQVHAYSGQDGRLVDIIKLHHWENKVLDQKILDGISRNIHKINDPSYSPKSLDLTLPNKELKYRIQALKVDLHENEMITSPRLQELRIRSPRLSNLILYCSLMALRHINIVDLRVEKEDEHFIYFFLVSPRSQYRITSTKTFERDLIEELHKNVILIPN